MYEVDPFGPFCCTRSSCILRLNDEFRFIASSLDAEMVSNKKIVKYIKLLLVGSFLL